MNEQVPSKELVSELRKFSSPNVGAGFPQGFKLLAEAADEIERLQRELDAANAESFRRREQAVLYAELASGQGKSAPEPRAHSFDVNYQSSLVFAVRELLGSLPKSRDWFNPDAERVFREYLSDAKAHGQGTSQPPCVIPDATRKLGELAAAHVVMRLALQKIVSDGDFTAPEGMQRIARAALDSTASADALRASPPPRSEWQPIETAPKDGRMFLCWVRAVCYHQCEHANEYSADEHDVSDLDFCMWKPNDGNGYWDNMAGTIGDAQQVTHWMPLPSSPYSTATKGERHGA